MPYKIRKVNKRRCYSVKNLKKKKTFSKCTTRKNAQKQIRLLRALQFNKNFKPNERRRTSKGGTKPNKNKTVKIKMDKKTIAEEKKQIATRKQNRENASHDAILDSLKNIEIALKKNIASEKIKNEILNIIN